MQFTQLTHSEKTALAYLENARNADTQREADYHLRAAVDHADRAGMSLEAIEAKAAAIEAAEAVEATAPAKKTRCPHYATIKEFVNAAARAGLKMDDKDRARGAMGVYLGKRISSRSELTAADWNNAITGVNAGLLFW